MSDSIKIDRLLISLNLFKGTMGNNTSTLTIERPDDLPGSVRSLFIERVVRHILSQIQGNFSRFNLFVSDKMKVKNVLSGEITVYKIQCILSILPEALQRLPTRELWSYTVEKDDYGRRIYVFRKIFNSRQTQPSEIEVLPTHIANQTMRSAIEKEEQCSIMFAPLSEETVVLTSCGHLFSKEGLTTWFQTLSVMEHNCPTCSKHVLKVHSL